jgi:hypothetical protein
MVVVVLAHHEVVGLAAPMLVGASGLTVGVLFRLSATGAARAARRRATRLTRRVRAR